MVLRNNLIVSKEVFRGADNAESQCCRRGGYRFWGGEVIAGFDFLGDRAGEVAAPRRQVLSFGGLLDLEFWVVVGERRRQFLNLRHEWGGMSSIIAHLLEFVRGRAS